MTTIDNRQTFTFRTPNLLVKPFWKRGQQCYDSLIKVMAHSKEAAQGKYNEYVEIGKRLGFYK